MSSLAAAPPSPTLAANERVQARIAAGAPVLHLAFGEAGLPVLPGVADRLAAAAGANSYGPVAGSPAVREAVAGYFERRGLPTSADRILVAPGSKALLYALLTVLPGDVVLPRPSWVSYAAQAALAGKRVLDVPIAEQAGGVPDPEALRARARRPLASRGLEPAILVLTLPDNPTGTVAPAPLVEDVCEVAREHGLLIVCDEIYRDLAYEPDALRQPRHAAARERVRHQRAEQEHGPRRLADRVLPPAGWTAGRRRDGGAERDRQRGVVEPRRSDAARGHLRPRRARRRPRARRPQPPPAPPRHDRGARAGHRRRRPVPRRRRAPSTSIPTSSRCDPRWRAQGVSTGAQLAALLLERHDVAVLEGEAFGDDPGALRFRMATSLLHGRRRGAALGGAARRRPGGAAVDRRRAGAPWRGRSARWRT